LLKKTIEYKDFNGDTLVEDFYFHLGKAELVRIQMSRKGLQEYLQEIVDREDGAAVLEFFEDFILRSYGKKSPDGKRFIQTDEMRQEFKNSLAYDNLFMELCTNSEKAAEFVAAVIPEGLEEELTKLMATNDSPVKLVEARELSLQEATEMDQDELRSGLATGRYKLS
jgi:hypothetical protein